MTKRAILHKEWSESENVEETWAHYTVHGGKYREDFSQLYLAALLHDVGHVQIPEKITYWSELGERFGQMRAYRSTYEHFFKSFWQQIESIIEERFVKQSVANIADTVETLRKEEQEDKKKAWPSYVIDDFENIVVNIKGLENAGEDKQQILYYIMEIEALLEKVEDTARVTNREYEARLAASLHDICRIHEPSELSNEQRKRFTDSVLALIEGWGELNREKVKWIRKRLLEVRLTWLPVTERAQKVIDEAKSSMK